MEQIIEKILKIKNGFKPIEFEAVNIFNSKTIHFFSSVKSCIY